MQDDPSDTVVNCMFCVHPKMPASRQCYICGAPTCVRHLGGLDGPVSLDCVDYNPDVPGGEASHADRLVVRPAKATLQRLFHLGCYDRAAEPSPAPLTPKWAGHTHGAIWQQKRKKQELAEHHFCDDPGPGHTHTHTHTHSVLIQILDTRPSPRPRFRRLRCRELPILVRRPGASGDMDGSPSRPQGRSASTTTQSRFVFQW